MGGWGDAICVVHLAGVNWADWRAMKLLDRIASDAVPYAVRLAIVAFFATFVLMLLVS